MKPPHYRISLHCWSVQKMEVLGEKIHKHVSGCMRYGFFKDDNVAKEEAREVWKMYPDLVREIKIFDSKNELILHHNNFKDYGL